jgi:hypothetical protein
MRTAVGFFAAGDITSPNNFEMPFRLSAWINSAPTEGISAKFDIGSIYGNIMGNFTFG